MTTFTKKEVMEALEKSMNEHGFVPIMLETFEKSFKYYLEKYEKQNPLPSEKL